MLDKWFIYAGIGLVLMGLILVVIGFITRFHLPGDILIQKGNFTVFIPITSSLIASLLLSGLAWLIFKLASKP